MIIDNAALKQRSRQWMRELRPAPWLVTLLYIITTSWITTAAQEMNPVAQRMDELTTQLQLASINMDEGAMNTAMQSLTQLASTRAFFFTLLSLVLLMLYAAVVEFGYYSYCLRITQEEHAGIGELFSRFYMAGKIIAAVLLMALFISLWSMLFLIPGIVAFYRYRLVPYLLLDDPDMSVFKAFRQSKLMMYGRKMELFTLDFSFLPLVLGVMLLSNAVAGLAGTGILSLVVAMVVSTACNLYVFPYQQLTYAQWYRQVYSMVMPPETDRLF